MTRAVVTVLGLAGWTLAVVLVVRLRDTAAPSTTLGQEVSVRDRLWVLAGRDAVGPVGSVVAHAAGPGHVALARTACSVAARSAEPSQQCVGERGGRAVS